MEEKQIEKFNPDNKATPIDRVISPEDREFIKMYEALGDAGKALSAAFPHKHYKKASLKVIGSKLVKKYGLKDKTRSHLNETSTIRNDNRADEMVANLKRKYKDGVIDENKMFSEMTYLAYHYEDAKVRLDALKTLHIWYDKVKAEVQANKLEGVDVVELMGMAIATLPKDTYLSVLRLARKERATLLKERGKKIDVDKIFKEERQINVKEVTTEEDE